MDNINKIIERAKQQLEHMIDLTPQVMLLLDTEDTIIRANKALLHLLGFSDFNEVLGKKFEDLFPGEPKDANHKTGNVCPELLDIHKKGSEIWEKELRLPDNEMHTLQFSIVNTSGDGSFSIIVIHDVTEAKKEAGDQKKEHKKDAVKELAGALMHNINQPLTVIAVQAQLIELALEEVDVPKEVKEQLRDIQQLVLFISGILARVENTNDFITEDYPGGLQIMDIKRSSKDVSEGKTLAATGIDFSETVSFIAVNGLVDLLEEHEPGAAIHASRTAEYAEFMGKHLGLKGRDLGVLKKCALLHDIGKIGISDKILQKPSSLDDEEMAKIRKHPRIGYELLSHFPFLSEEAETAFCHQERYDGTGYPRGLKGKDIPLKTRLITVVDVFETLRHGRPYRKEMSLENAVEEISANAETQFDPDMVELLKSCYKELDALGL